jgi:hypothetical protein
LEGGGGGKKAKQTNVSKEKEVNPKGNRGWRTPKKLCIHSKGEESWMRKSEKK